MVPAPHQYRDTRVPTDLRRLISVAIPNPLVVVWRWRYEIILLAGLMGGLTAGIISLGAVPTIVAAIFIILTILYWPSARRLTINRAWCVITAHRVRVGCVEGLIYSSRGKIPVVLWTSHQAFGERVLLYCRAGTSVDDFVSARTTLTTACWAQDIAIFVDVRHTQLVTLDVMRRPVSDPTSDFEGHRSPEPSGKPPVWPGNQDV